MKTVTNNNTGTKFPLRGDLPVRQAGLEVPDIYGIPNCDITKKTLDWLKEKWIPVKFHNYKTEGVTKEKLVAWCKTVGWEVLLNKRSTSWRELTAAQQGKITNEAAAIEMMMKNNSIIKRPVIEYAKGLLVGFNETAFNKHLK